MYIKVFESRQSSRWFIIKHDISIRGLDHGVIHLENEQHKRIAISEDKIFNVIDKLFEDESHEES